MKTKSSSLRISDLSSVGRGRRNQRRNDADDENNNVTLNLSKLVSLHANPHLGLTNVLLNSICKSFCPTHYVGLYSPEKIPVSRLRKLSKFTFIILLSGAPTGHYVLVHASPSTIYYIDPYGLPCFDGKVLKFLYSSSGKKKEKKKKKRAVLINKRQIQHEKSVYCGMYVVLYSVYFDSSLRQSKVNIKFHQNPSLANDKLCIQYINSMLK